MRSSLPFVSVIVCVFNGARTLNECLNSLLCTDFPRDRREIVVVDNGSTDRSPEIIRSFPVTYVREDKRGLPHARNKAVEVSHGDILAFTDQDCIVTTGWLRELMGGFLDSQADMVVGETASCPARTRVERYTARSRPIEQRVRIEHRTAPWFKFENVAIRRDIFNRVGLFDPQFNRAGEDTDFSWRCFQENCFKPVYRPKALVFHRNRDTAGALFRQYYRYGYGQAQLCRKYPTIVSWTWKKELSAYHDLFGTGLALCRSVIPWVLGNRDTFTALNHFSCELVRKLGARIGFIQGSFHRSGI